MSSCKASFCAYGHENILGAHKNTIEFTKDKELSLNGDCIVGVNCDFSFSSLKKLLKFNKFRLVMRVDKLLFELYAKVNPNFCDDHEIVIRRSGFDSKRTLGIRSDKAAIDIGRNMIERLKSPKARIEVDIFGLE